MLVVERARVVEMITLSWQAVNITDGINFDNIVTNANMCEHLRYWILEDKVLLDKKGKSKKKTKQDRSEAALPGGPPK